MERTQSRRRRAWRRSVVALLGAGSLFTPTCISRVRDAVFQGTQDFAFSLLDPTPFVEAILGGSDSSSGS